MSFRSEAEMLAEERLRVERKLSAQGRAFARWFPPPREPEPEHFVWRNVADLFPEEPAK